MSLLRSLGTDPFRRSILALVAMAAAGGVGLIFASARVGALHEVDHQLLPFVASGGLGGIALIGTGLALVCIQAQRRLRADRQALLRRVAVSTAALRDVIAPNSNETRPT